MAPNFYSSQDSKISMISISAQVSKYIFVEPEIVDYWLPITGSQSHPVKITNYWLRQTNGSLPITVNSITSDSQAGRQEERQTQTETRNKQAGMQTGMTDGHNRQADRQEGGQTGK